MRQQAPQKTASWAILVCTLVAFGCGDATTGPDPDPDPNAQLGEVLLESSIDMVMAVGRSMQLTATVTNADGTVVSGANLDWRSSNDQIAIVSGGGLVTALGAGHVTITATHNGLDGSIPLQVIDADLEAIAALRNDPLMHLLVAQLDGDLAQQLTAAFNDLDGALTAGNCMAMRDALQDALAGTSGSSNPSDVITLAVLGLVLERAQDLLNLN